MLRNEVYVFSFKMGKQHSVIMKIEKVPHHETIYENKIIAKCIKY